MTLRPPGQRKLTVRVRMAPSGWVLDSDEQDAENAFEKVS